MSSQQQIAEAFSSHRFDEAYAFLAEDVRWVLVGAETIHGQARVREICEQTSAELADTRTEFLRFLTIAGVDAMVIDAVGRYTGSDGTTSLVSSCDVYEFRDDLVTTITSYTVEIDEFAASSQSG